MEIVETFTLKPDTASEFGEFFFVYVGDTPVAGVARIPSGKWIGINDETEYDSPLLAAFADANLSDPAHWTS